jgi:hypothetical protein
MSESWAQGLTIGCGVYLGMGAALALVGLVIGPQRIDEGAQGMPWSARLLIFAGLVALWPLMLKRWLTRQQPPVS